MKLLRYSYVSLAIVLGCLAILASNCICTVYAEPIVIKGAGPSSKIVNAFLPLIGGGTSPYKSIKHKRLLKNTKSKVRWPTFKMNCREVMNLKVKSRVYRVWLCVTSEKAWVYDVGSEGKALSLGMKRL